MRWLIRAATFATFGLGVQLWLAVGLLAVQLFNAVGAWVGANATWEWLAFGILAAFVVFVTSATIVEAVHRRKRTGSQGARGGDFRPDPSPRLSTYFGDPGPIWSICDLARPNQSLRIALPAGSGPR